MVLHMSWHRRRQAVIEKVGYAVPDMSAIDHHGSHLRPGWTRLNCGARCFCSRILARWRRTFTDEWLIPPIPLSLRRLPPPEFVMEPDCAGAILPCLPLKHSRARCQAGGDGSN